jgi:uncharacterized coiled-coil protein SlyX
MKKKALVIFSLLALLAIPVMGLVGCGGGTTLTDNDLATIRGLLTRMDSTEQKAATQDATIATLNSKTVPDLSNYMTLDKYNDLLSKYNGLLDETNPNSLVSRIKALEAKGGGNTPPPTNPTGQVTAELINPNPLWISAGTAPAQFQVRITNNTGAGQFVGFDLRFDIYPSTTAPQVITGATLTCLTNASWTPYWTAPIGIPNAIDGTHAQSSILSANTQKFWVAPTTSSVPPTELFFSIQITGPASTWKCGSVSGVAWSSTGP